MKQFKLTGVLMLLCIIFSSCKNARAENATANFSNEPVVETTSNAGNKIQVAILLDTSSSMDGLINQAKSRLWNIVNTLTTLRFNGKEPEIQIALYEYGNDGLSASSGYVRLVAPLTTDLDLISEKLFALTTNGGLEYCGTVIDKATKELKWSTNDKDIHLVYIAGNEPFTQGSISYKEAISDALRKNITVNTIHCGDRDEGVSGMWKDGADKGNSKFFNINHNAQVRYIVTPYDDRIDECNVRLNGTYIGYGRIGESKKQNQAAQDKNAESISSANKAERIVSKTKTAYKNESWDLVDLAEENEKALKNIKQSELPKELQGKSEAEMKSYVAEKKEERVTIQKEIESLAKQRQAYIDNELKKSGENSGDDLGKAINQSVLEIAATKGYKAE
ncbi:MAG: VWA domain-containing protein [Tannerella sp.]|jgi:cyclophilin family peptidyl-prolyl cis-trans isomerase|nr:VWA domain-containing protein [Tannerella sp.]